MLATPVVPVGRDYKTVTDKDTGVDVYVIKPDAETIKNVRDLKKAVKEDGYAVMEPRSVPGGMPKALRGKAVVDTPKNRRAVEKLRKNGDGKAPGAIDRHVRIRKKLTPQGMLPERPLTLEDAGWGRRS